LVVITIETLGDERFIRAFNRVGEEVKDFSEPFETIYQDFAALEERRFLAQGWPPAHWAPLSPEYAAWKQRHFPGRPILVLSGRMRAAFGNVDGSSFDALKEIFETHATFGTVLPYPIYHQTGTSKMPARRPVHLEEEDKRRWALIIQRWAIAKLREATAEGGAAGAA
jgi:phage gpG-like protein